MSVSRPADVVMYVCCNCMPPGSRLPRQWQQNGLLVAAHEVPCSGKTDVQYLFHAFEGGARAVCVVACPPGECRLAQGNYRAEVRVRTVRRLIGEVGLNPDCVSLVHCSKSESPERFEGLVRESVAALAPAVKAAEALSPAAVAER